MFKIFQKSPGNKKPQKGHLKTLVKRKSDTKDNNFPNIEINEYFKKALDLMENTDKTLFITGKAGTGKSTLLQYFRDITNKKVAVLAPTGVAALNVKGQTIHSFFHFKPNITKEKIRVKDPSKKLMELLSHIDSIVIDEISMVRADLLDCVD